MTSTAEPIIAHLRQEFEELLSYVTGPSTRASTAYEVERTLFRRLLALGAALLRLFFLTRAAARPAEPVAALLFGLRQAPLPPPRLHRPRPAGGLPLGCRAEPA